MKTSLPAAVMAALVGVCTQVHAQSSTTPNDAQKPQGSLEASPGFVRPGVLADLTWSITYPAAPEVPPVEELIDIEEPGTIVPKVPVKMEVRVIGSSVKAVWTNSLGKLLKWEWVPTEAQVSINRSSYSRIFYSTQDLVNPNAIVYTKKMKRGERADFGGRYYFQNAWSNMFTTTNGRHNVVALINGDIPPTTTPLYQQPTIESFIKPYLDSQGRIKIGPRDVIYLMELTHTDRNDGGFDLQDLALLVTFTKQ